MPDPPADPADPDGADDLTVAAHRNAAGEDHDAPVVGSMDPVELLVRLGVLGQVLGGKVESACGEGLVNGDVDAAQPGSIHPHVGDEVSAGIDDGDVHGLADLRRARFGGGNDGAGVCEIQRHGTAPAGGGLGGVPGYFER
jgi:hypothetical protein